MLVVPLGAMDEPNAATANTRVAIELLTLWLEPGEEARYRAAAHILQVLGEPTDEGALAHATEVVAGLLNLSMLLVVRLAHEQGADRDAMLEVAGDILRAIAPNIPE